MTEAAPRGFTDVVRARRMTRAFEPTPIDPRVVDGLVDLASRAPSAGKTQGWHLLALDAGDTGRFWDVTLPLDRRATFRWRQLLDAPVILLPFADPHAYVDRYAEADKASTGLGTGADAWPAPYWTIDASMAVMTLLLGAEAAGLGALFFGVFHDEAALRTEFGIPEHLQLLGAIALGHRAESAPAPGRSASRPRRSPDEIIHRNRW